MWMPMQMIAFYCGKETVPVVNSLKAGSSTPSHPREMGDIILQLRLFMLMSWRKSPENHQRSGVLLWREESSRIETWKQMYWTLWNGGVLSNSHLLVTSLMWGISLVPGLFPLKQHFHLFRVLRSIKLLFQLNRWDNLYQ